MGLENRDYYRDGSYTDRLTGLGVDFTPVVKYLIVANVIAFLLQIFTARATTPEDIAERLKGQMEQQQAEWQKVREAAKKAQQPQPAADEDEDGEADETDRQKQLREEALRRQKQLMEQMLTGFSPRVSVVQEWLQLDPEKTVKQGQVWRLVTCAFCHDRYGVWHILVNMLLLYWAGTRMESMYGSREFLLFYLAAAVSSSVAYVALALYTGSNTPAIGASGAVMGVMTLYAIFYPFETIRLFWFFPVPIWVMLAVYVIYDLHPVLLALAGDSPLFFSGVAHAGHLGGMAFGFLYWKLGVRLEAPFEGRSPPPRRRPRRKAEPVEETAPVAPAEERDSFNDQVDEVLRKISEQGQASLTEQERAILLKASARYRGGR